MKQDDDMTSEMSPDARALIASARANERPRGGEKARIRAAIFAATASGAAASAAATSASAASATAASASVSAGAGASIAPAAAGLGAIATKAVVGLAVVGAVAIGGATAVSMRPHATPKPAATAYAPAPTAPRESVRNLVNEAAHATPTAPALTPAAEPPAVAPIAPPVTQPPAAPGPARTAPAAAAPEDALKGETALLLEAQRALDAGDAARALRLLDEHAARYPRALLEEERSAARVLAYCGVGRAFDARVEADRFLRNHPRSPLAARVRSSCGGASRD